MTEQTLDRGDPETLVRFQVGEPVEHRGIVVAPLFPLRDPVARYATLDEALERGLEITETGPGRERARARRLQPARRCRAALRRRGARRGEAEPHPRRQRARRRALEARDPRIVRRAGQVALRLGRSSPPRATSRTPSCGARRPTRSRPAAALAARRRARSGARCTRSSTGWRLPRRQRRTTTPLGPRAVVAGLETAFPALPGQCGAVLGLGDALCLDVVSRPGAFAALWPKLRTGYLLDALEQLDDTRTRPERIHGFVDEVGQAPAERSPAAGLGVEIRLHSPGCSAPGSSSTGS